MIYVCVPVHNEARTAGLVLWKVRQVFTAFPREYELLVLDDASTDDTREVLASYAKVLPMTKSEEHTSELQSPCNLVCRLLLEKKKKKSKKLYSINATHTLSA